MPRLAHQRFALIAMSLRRCLDCHRGTAPEGGLDLTRFASARSTLGKGKLDRSRLWQHIRDDEMPPGKPLPDAEKAVLRAWIAAGPSWGTDPIDPYRLTTDNRRGFDWWSLQSICCATLPAVARHAWARNPIDRFVLAKLEAHRLAPSARADRRTLLRRLTFDLLGLPPTPEEVTGYACGFVLVS